MATTHDDDLAGPLRLTLRQLRVFAAVARSGSTVGAGEEIALSQSATSGALNELERAIGLRLFDRAGRRLVLNDNGRTLLPRALALLEDASAIARLGDDPGRQLQELRVGASLSLGEHVLPRLLARLLSNREPSRAPSWRSRAVVANTAAVARAVAAFELDIGLIEGPCHEPTLQAHAWLHDELLPVVAPGHALARRGKPTLAEWRDAVWLLREPGSGTRESTDQALLPKLGSWRRSIELGSLQALKLAAAEGLGVACLSRWAVEDFVAAGRLVVPPSPLPRIVRQCHLVVRRGQQPTPALARFVACALEHAREAEAG